MKVGDTVTGATGHTGVIVPTPENYYEPRTVRRPWLVHVRWENGAVTPEDKATLRRVRPRGGTGPRVDRTARLDSGLRSSRPSRRP